MQVHLGGSETAILSSIHFTAEELRQGQADLPKVLQEPSSKIQCSGPFCVGISSFSRSKPRQGGVLSLGSVLPAPPILNYKRRTRVTSFLLLAVSCCRGGWQPAATNRCTRLPKPPGAFSSCGINGDPCKVCQYLSLLHLADEC